MTNYDWNCEKFLTYLEGKKEGIQNTLKAMENVATDEAMPLMTWGAELCEEIMQDTIDTFLKVFQWDDDAFDNVQGKEKDARIEGDPQIRGKIEEINIGLKVLEDIYGQHDERIHNIEKKLKDVESEYTTNEEYQSCRRDEEFQLFKAETIENVEDTWKRVEDLDFKNGKYDAQICEITDRQDETEVRLKDVDEKIKVLAQKANVIFVG